MQHLKLPELLTLAATRGVLGIGVGLLLAGSLAPRPRRRLGLAMLTVGAFSTLPLLRRVFGEPQQRRRAALGASDRRDAGSGELARSRSPEVPGSSARH